MNDNQEIRAPWGPLLTTIIRGLASKPEAVTFVVQRLPKSVLVTIRTDTNDCPRIIGKKGATIRAVQLLMKEVGKRCEDEVRITVLEGKGERLPAIEFEPDRNWTRDGELRALVESIAFQLFEKPVVIDVTPHGVQTVITLWTCYNPPVDPFVLDAIGQVLRATGGCMGRSVDFQTGTTKGVV